MSVGYPWYFFLPTVMMIAFCIGAIVFVASRPGEFGRSKRYAVTALSLILIGPFVFPLLFSGLALRFVDPGSAGMISKLTNSI